MTFDRLFEPFSAREKLSLPNRLVMAPMTTTSGETDGSFSLQEIQYLERRAALGIGLIMSPACYVHKSGHSFDHQVGCHSDGMLPRLAQCAGAINRHGGASFLQIHHGGNAAREEYAGRPPMAPSAVINRRQTSEMPRAMTESEIEEIIHAFGDAAGRAQKAGFTGIEIHGANTYLFQQFFSPFTNRRTDHWGCQSMENRCRFAVETIRAIRAVVGEDYPVAYRISPEEPEPDGYSTYDAIELLRRIVPLGIDIVDVSGWEYGAALRSDLPPGMHPTLLVRKEVPPDVAVIGVGGIKLPDQAMTVLQDGIELVAMGKALLLNADWAEKVRTGQIESIRTAAPTREEINRLEIPVRMRDYVERFFLNP